MSINHMQVGQGEDTPKDDLAKLDVILDMFMKDNQQGTISMVWSSKELKAEAKTALTQLIIGARMDELDRTIAFFGDERPKWESEKVLKAFVKNRKAELKALGTTTNDFQ